MNCPRCGKSHFNTFNICRYKNRVPVNKCVVCGFLWITDEDLKILAKDGSKKMFIEMIRNLGKDGNKRKTDSS